MKKENNIYSYESPKSNNEETHLLLTKGRITIKSFALRLLFAFTVIVFSLFFKFYTVEKYNYFVYFVLIISFVFILIQGVKRLHDSNKSGWYILIPFYNFYLLFIEGTLGGNNFGLDPRVQKKVTYFDELGEESTPNPPKKAFLISFVVISLLLIPIWFYFQKDNSSIPKKKAVSDTTKRMVNVIKPIEVNCKEFSKLISSGSQLMGESNLQKKEQALVYFTKAKDLLSNGCNNPENVTVLEKKQQEFKNQAKNAESGYETLSNEEKKGPVGEILSNRARYFHKASTILAIHKK